MKDKGLGFKANTSTFLEHCCKDWCFHDAGGGRSVCMEMLCLPAKNVSWLNARPLPEGCVAETSQDHKKKALNDQASCFSLENFKPAVGICLGKLPQLEVLRLP